MQDIKELGFIALIAVLAIAGVQWFLLRFSHWSVALIATVLIGIFISSLYVSLKHATPNGGSNGPPNSEYIAPAIILVTSLLLGMWLVSFVTKNQVPKFAIIIPIGLMFVFVIARNVYEDINSTVFWFTNFSSCNIELLDKSDGKSNVEDIEFHSSTSGFSTSILIKPKVSMESGMVRFIDTIDFRTYSSKTRKTHIAKYPFDYNLFKEQKGPTIGYCFWVRSYSTLPLKIVLLPNDKVDLYLGGNLIKQYQLNDK